MFKKSLLSIALLSSLPVYMHAKSPEQNTVAENAAITQESESTKLAKELIDILQDITIQRANTCGCCPCKPADTCKDAAKEAEVEKEIEAKIQKAIDLVNKGADVAYVSEDGATPLMGAVSIDNLELTKLLLEKKANPNQNEEINPIIIATASGNIEIVKLLIAHGADVNSKLFGSNTALITAIVKNDLVIASLLIENGADVNAICETAVGTKKFTFTALNFAMNTQNTELVKFLLENGADVNFKDGEGKTVLDYAKLIKNQELVELLEKYSSQE